jgi:SAM-dependent methyltransferase
MTQNSIHDVVREHYGAIARSVDTSSSSAASCCNPTSDAGSCCGNTGCGTPVKLYDDQLLADLPVDVTGLSLGCGDPVTIASLLPGETVLDLGSGGGIDCFLAARQVGENGYVIGVDMTPDMLMKANANKIKMGVNNVEFRKGQIEALPVTDNSVDVVMSNCVINLSPDKSAVFREAIRVLKPGGRVSISDIVTEGEFSPALRADAAKWAECVTGAIDVDAYTGLMRDAGFVNIQVVDKVDTGGMIERQPGTPRVFSARITAYKPE